MRWNVILAIAMALFVGILLAQAHGEENAQEKEEAVLYTSSVDYMGRMIRHAAEDDMESLHATIVQRNAKIEGEGLDEAELLSVESFLSNFETYAGFSLETDYLAEMAACCLRGDTRGGEEAESLRNRKIEATGSQEAKIAYQDLFLLSKIITAEAGSSWLPMEWKMKVGEVLLNRVASPEFPDTIEACIYQPGQYYSQSNPYFASLLPWEDSVQAAARLLSGERLICNPSVVFQANFPQGSGTHEILRDDHLGNTYLCYSNYPERYQ